MRLRLDGTEVVVDWDDPALGLTECQRRAMATDRELVVTVGTSKTHTVALRYR